jgi:hypothetical protein
MAAIGREINFEIPDDLADIRAAVRQLCESFPGEYWQKLEPSTYPTEFVQALTDHGWLAALIPEEYGGSGLSITYADAMLEEICASGRLGPEHLDLARRAFAPIAAIGTHTAAGGGSAQRRGLSTFTGGMRALGHSHDQAVLDHDQPLDGTRRLALNSSFPTTLASFRALLATDGEGSPAVRRETEVPATS